MYAVTVTFTIAPGHMAAFLALIEENAAQSLANEARCHQFDICTDPSVPDQVFLYELYSDRAGFESHMTEPHFKTFDAATAEMIAGKAVQCFETVKQ